MATTIGMENPKSENDKSKKRLMSGTLSSARVPRKNPDKTRKTRMRGSSQFGVCISGGGIELVLEFCKLTRDLAVIVRDSIALFRLNVVQIAT